ncbi:MAG: hypothetical protein KF795_00315 [Labilithrix sp.]|nr:hypothetical protein [Labilithrix sp.]
MVAPLDAAMEVLTQGLTARLPGLGTSTALSYIGRTRGILRGQNETDADYAARLRGWLDRWRIAGSMDAIALTLHEYLSTRPRVRVVNRAGFMVTVGTDGTITREQTSWDWDSVSHPDRAGFWSELWIIVYSPPWAKTGPFLNTAGAPTWGEDEYGIGHDVSREEHDAVKALLAQWKGAHTQVRAVVFTFDLDAFNPSNPSSMPDGRWGAWGNTGSGIRTFSPRDYSTSRFWEFD